MSLSSTRRISSFATAHWDREGEGRASAHLTLHPNPSTMQLNEFPTESEAEPGALGLLLGAPHLPELLEHGLLILRSDSDAAVGDRHLGHAVQIGRAHV